MMSRSLAALQPDLDDWLLAPTTPTRKVIKCQTVNARARVRFLLFDLGRGALMRLGPADAALVRAEIEDSYRRYRTKAIIEGRLPRSRRAYFLKWRALHRGCWRRESLDRVRGRLEAA